MSLYIYIGSRISICERKKKGLSTLCSNKMGWGGKTHIESMDSWFNPPMMRCFLPDRGIKWYNCLVGSLKN
jgi:hypothetical protein